MAVTARTLFAPLGPTYDRYGALLSFGQDPRWRRFLVSRLDVRSDDRVLDVATGTGLVARELVRRFGCSVVGIDQSPEMLARRSRANERACRSRLVEGRAEALPFADGEFASLTVTYLLRYVDDPAATMRELARVVRPGGTVAMLEFAVPRGVWRPLWELWVRVGLPGAGRLISPGWHEVGALPRPEHPRVLASAHIAALFDAASRVRAATRLDGGRRGGCRASAAESPVRGRRRATMNAETRPAFYALSRGGWRDYVTLLHPPYTLWHLSYVAVGAGLASPFSWRAAPRRSSRSRSRWASARTPSTSFTADRSVRRSPTARSGRSPSCRSQPLRRSGSTRASLGRGGSRRSSSRAPSSSSRTTSSCFGGAFHSTLWFALAWGSLPALSAYVVEAETLRLEAVAAAAYAALLSYAQRVLSTPARAARRQAGTVRPRRSRPR